MFQIVQQQILSIYGCLHMAVWFWCSGAHMAWCMGQVWFGAEYRLLLNSTRRLWSLSQRIPLPSGFCDSLHIYRGVLRKDFLYCAENSDEVESYEHEEHEC